MEVINNTSMTGGGLQRPLLPPPRSPNLYPHRQVVFVGYILIS